MFPFSLRRHYPYQVHGVSLPGTLSRAGSSPEKCQSSGGKHFDRASRVTGDSLAIETSNINRRSSKSRTGQASEMPLSCREGYESAASAAERTSKEIYVASCSVSSDPLEVPCHQA